MLEVVRELILKLPIPDGRPASTVSQRVSSLDHELRDDTVEDDTLVVSAACVANKVLHSLWRLLGKQAKVHVPNGRVDSSGISDG